MGLEHLAYTALVCVMSTVGWPGLQSGLARQRNLRKVRSACIASKRQCLDEVLMFELCMLPFSLTAGGGVSKHPCVMLASMLLRSEDVGFYECAFLSARVQYAPCADLSGARMPVGRPWYWATALSARENIVRPAKSLPDTAMLACSPLTCNTQTVRGEALSQVALMTHQYQHA